MYRVSLDNIAVYVKKESLIWPQPHKEVNQKDCGAVKVSEKARGSKTSFGSFIFIENNRKKSLQHAAQEKRLQPVVQQHRKKSLQLVVRQKHPQHVAQQTRSKQRFFGIKAPGGQYCRVFLYEISRQTPFTI